jgi:hypothetical protein
MHGVTYFSLRSVIAFLTMFGWVGFLCIQNGISQALVLPIALAAGVAAFLAVAFLLHSLYKMSSSGNVTAVDAVGAVGTVYLSIPEGKNAAGAVNVAVNQGMCEFSAVSEDSHAIKTGAKVKVTGTVNERTLIVRGAEEPKPA